MRRIKRFGIVLSLVSVGVMMIGIPATAKENEMTSSGFSDVDDVDVMSSENINKIIEKYRIYDTEHTNYCDSINSSLKTYMSSGYIICDLKSLNNEVSVPTVPKLNERILTNNGIFCIDYYERRSTGIIVSKMSRADYESYFLNGRKIKNSLDHVVVERDENGMPYSTAIYDPKEEVVRILDFRYNGDTLY